MPTDTGQSYLTTTSTDMPIPSPGATRPPESIPLPERHQAALHHIRALEGHNAKLYQDNCHLASSINKLNDRLAFMGAPQNTQLLRLSDMQEKLRVSDEHRAATERKYQELLQCISAGSGHHHVYVELQSSRDAYASLDREYRLLREKYVRLKAVADTSRTAHHQSQGSPLGLVPIPRPEFRPQDQPLTNTASPTSAVSPGSVRPSPDHNGNHRRRSAESVMAPSALRSGPTSVPSAWSGPLPTPPPSASLPGSGTPVHASVPAGFLPLPYHAQMTHDPRNLSGLPSVTQSPHIAPTDIVDRLRQRCAETADAANDEPVQCGTQIMTAASLESSPRSLKRPNSELQTLTSPGGERKKPRTEEVINPTTNNVDTRPENKVLSPPVSTDPHNDHKTETDSDFRSYQDCVNLIFEKDADVENGVFCGLCFDRYQANMIPEPPDVLVHPDLDFLVEHCKIMHPTVWEDLRRKA